ncbi:DUF6022 family protein [Bacillus glycinifermentans]|uniref:DUF6022 family protein n=1 Tax=Bacillus glycinifermentans TaxID=1664069 RepID=UPI001FF368F2|nr:DUF6022 family protein [Bacillus glycinifermentans]UOY86707.1 DUF6022 family protein [Bacillus glycinifermentans]
MDFWQDMSIEEIGEQMQRFVSHNWKKTLHDHYEELTKAFPELEDSTYGLYLDKLMPPAFESLEACGFKTTHDTKKSDFLIGKSLNFRHSIEKWGTEEQRSRVFWIVVRDRQNNPIGTLLFDFFHSHTGFNVPKAPKISVIRETERGNIVEAVKRMKETG